MMLGFQASYYQNSCDFEKRFFFFFSSDQPTEKKETHSTLNKEKGDGLTEVKKNTVFLSAESRALQSRHFVESGCLWIHVLNFPKC